MKKILILVTLLAMGSALSVSAQQDLLSKDFSLLGTSQEGANTVYQIRHSSGFTFTVSMQEAPTQDHVRIFEAVARTVGSMKFLNPASARIVFVGKRAEIVVLPKTFSYKGKDFIPFMPSGIQFVTIPILSNTISVSWCRIFSCGSTASTFPKNSSRTRSRAPSKIPYAYIQTHDPEYIIRKFQEIEKNIEEIKASIAATKTDLTSTNNNLAVANKKAETLGADFTLLRFALLVLNNRGFFGSINLPSQEAIAKLVALKKSEPGLTMKDAEARLQAQGVVMTSKEVFLVFSVYFNEFQ